MSDGIEDRLARLTGALDQYGELLKRLAGLLGTYDDALASAGVDPLVRAALLTEVQTTFLQRTQ